jgi:hypothetical protein
MCNPSTALTPIYMEDMWLYNTKQKAMRMNVEYHSVQPGVVVFLPNTQIFTYGEFRQLRTGNSHILENGIRVLS